MKTQIPRVNPMYRHLAYKDWIEARRNLNQLNHTRKEMHPEECRVAMACLREASRRWKLMRKLH